MAAGKVAALAESITTTCIVANEANVPFDGATLSQFEEPKTDQTKLEGLALLNTKVAEVALNGPPAGPLAVNPVIGEISRLFGAPASASIRGWPAGVPHPVHRSYPATA